MPSTPLKGLPPYPGNSVVSPASIPEPPLLNADDPEDYRVRLLASAFRCAVEKQYGVKCFLLANISPRSKSYATLAKIAPLFDTYGVAPVAWCMFAVRRWYLARTHTDGYREGSPVPLPPVGVIFSAKQINERLSEDRHRDAVVTSVVGGRLIFGKTHKALLIRYAELRKAIARGHSKEEAMGLMFPGTSYDDMVEAAKVEAVEIRNRLEDDIRRGRYVW